MDDNSSVTNALATPRGDVEEGKARLQAMLKEGKRPPIQVEKRYPGAGFLRMVFDEGLLTIERFDEEGKLHRKHTEIIVPILNAAAVSRVN